MNPDQLPKLGQWPTSATLCIASIWIRTVAMGTFCRGFIL